MNEQNELLREIDEDLRREKMRLWWKNFGGRVVTASVAVVVLTVGVVLWQNHARERDTENTGRLLAAARLEEQGKVNEAADAYGAVAEGARGNFKTLATVREADARTAAGQGEEARKLYRAAYESNAARDHLRDLAGLRLANGLLATPEGEKEAHGILTELAREGRPYRWTALETLALLDWKQNRIAEARAGLQLLAQAEVPESMKSRVASALSSLPEAGADAR